MAKLFESSLSSIHYPQLEDIKYFEVSANAEHFAADIINILGMSQEKLLSYANQSGVIKRNFNPAAWSNSMATIESKI